jgi:hypothetical protein
LVEGGLRGKCSNTSLKGGGHYQLCLKKVKEKVVDAMARSLGRDVMRDLGTIFFDRKYFLKQAQEKEIKEINEG